MWHAETEKWRANDELVVIGVTQEQHPERCQLFAQWHGIDWPILHDPINLMGATAVPYFIAIDEHGVVRATRSRVQSFEDDFLSQSFEQPQQKGSLINFGPDSLSKIADLAKDNDDALAWRDYGDALLLWEHPRPLEKVIAAYKKSLELSAEDGRTDFRLGVAYRMRFESEEAREGDFQLAVNGWQTALQKDPNQYIWRRRIQQYGPRLDKPYPFYDWVESARSEITSRGETPIELAVEPQGAELAQPARQLVEEQFGDDLPARLKDDDGRVNRDTSSLVGMRTVVVQGTGRTSSAFQVHLEFFPNNKVHWNNETDPMVVWIEPHADWAFDKRGSIIQNNENPESNESRSVQFEIRANEPLEETRTLKGYALFNVCEEQGGQCLFLRRDFEIELGPAATVANR